jgi:hypothetical protein
MFTTSRAQGYPLETQIPWTERLGYAWRRAQSQAMRQTSATRKPLIGHGSRVVAKLTLSATRRDCYGVTGLPINFSAMPDLEDQHHQLLILDAVNHAVVTDANPV